MDPMTMAALITGGSNLIGGLMGSSSAKSQNKAAAEQAQKEMDFQERMSSTVHQREVADLRAAGLNPILSAHGGASSPGGAMAPVVNTTEPLRDSLKSSAQGVQQAMLNREQVKVMRSQTGLNQANARLADANTAVTTGGKIGFMGTSIPVDAFSSKSLANTPGASEIISAWQRRRKAKGLNDGSDQVRRFRNASTGEVRR